jgi:type I restriction enzyme S subunit
LPLGDVVRFGNGKAIKPGGTGIYPVYGSNGIIGGSNEFRHENGVVIGRVGAYCGSVVYCPTKFWASDNTLVAYPASESVDTKFLYYLLADANLSRYAGGAAQPLVTQTVLKQVEVTVPPLPIQRRIAGILSAYDELIENSQRRIKILEAMARALYREWFVHFRFPGHESVPRVPSPLGEIPQGWEVTTLGAHLATLESGKRPKGGIRDVRDGVPSIGAENINGIGQHDFASEKFIPREFFQEMRKGIVRDGDVAIYKDGAYIGKSSYFRDGFRTLSAA